MVGDYISRDAAIKAVCDSSAHTCNLKNCFHGCQEAQAILAIPAADVVEVRHGRWNGGANGWECSVCMIESDNTYPHCPYCGTVMDGGQDDD